MLDKLRRLSHLAPDHIHDSGVAHCPGKVIGSKHIFRHIDNGGHCHLKIIAYDPFLRENAMTCKHFQTVNFYLDIHFVISLKYKVKRFLIF